MDIEKRRRAEEWGEMMKLLGWRFVSVRGRVALCVVLLVSWVLLLGSGPEADVPAAKPSSATSALPADAQRAQEILLPFKRGLKGSLEAGMAAGPVEAVRSCNLQSPAITDKALQEGVRVGRSSDRLRNPENAPEDWMRPLLATLAAEGVGASPRWTELSGGRFGYVEPIYVQPLCVNCHGSELTPELEARLHELYPQDRATGYVADDFRGIFWVVLEPGARVEVQ